MTVKKNLALLAAAACAMTLTACGGSEDAGDGTDATDATIPDFTLGLPAIPVSLDITKNYGPDTSVLGLVTQTLEAPLPDGSFEPLLAESVETPNPRTLVYNLREGVKFSDGSDLTTDDVVWSIEHLRERRAQTSSSLFTMKSVEATGDMQVTVTFTSENPAQRGTLAFLGHIQEKDAGEAAGADIGGPGAEPVGTGPYMVDNYGSSELTLTRNPEYWGEAPKPDEITVVPISDDNAGQLAMRSGSLTATPLQDPKTRTQWDAIEGATTYSSPSLFGDYVSMDTSKPPFDDVNVRKAIAYATDTEGLLQANFGDEASILRGMTPPQVLVSVQPSDSAFTDLVDQLPGYDFDMEKAKESLAQSSSPNGFTATYQYTTPAGKNVGLSLAENLKDLGITINLKPVTSAELYGAIYSGTVPQMAFLNLGAVTPDPGAWYEFLVAQGNPSNTALYSPPSSQEALAKINGADTEERWTGVTELVTDLMDDVPYVGLDQPNFVLALGDGVVADGDLDYLSFYTAQWINLVRSTA